MKGSAQLEIQPFDETSEGVESLRRTALKQEVAERLAAHRLRRARMLPATGLEQEEADPRRAPSKKDRIAAAVAERYAQTPSYRAFLAEEAQRATQQAQAAAEIAARNAQAVAAVQQELLAELELWTAPQEFSGETAGILPNPPAEAAPVPPASVFVQVPPPARRAAVPPAAAAAAIPVHEVSSAGLTVRLYEDAGRLEPSSAAPAVVTTNQPAGKISAEEAQMLDVLDEEIAFRQAPVFEDYSLDPPTPLPANLLEFPRQLVAAKKARPRLAEGPLREDAPRSPQLRIFEVEPEQISNVPAPQPSAPEWTTMRLDAHTPVETVPVPNSSLTAMPAYVTPEAAPISLRLMAGLVDAGLVIGAFFGCVAATVKLTGWLPQGPPAVMAAVGAIIGLYVCYHMLFFTLSDQTPGMRYARLGLCTMTDENPTRAAMRRRLLAQFIAIAPLGIGVLWALMDEDKLGWHDRISRMYQRAY